MASVVPQYGRVHTDPFDEGLSEPLICADGVYCLWRGALDDMERGTDIMQEAAIHAAACGMADVVTGKAGQGAGCGRRPVAGLLARDSFLQSQLNAIDTLGHAASFLSSHARALLLQNDTKRWSIECGGYLTNHLWHGVLALAALGADDAYLDLFVERYSQRLERSQATPRAAAAAAPGGDEPVALEAPSGDTGDCSSVAGAGAQEPQLLPLGTRTRFTAHVRAFRREVACGGGISQGPFLGGGGGAGASTAASRHHVAGTTLGRLLDGLAGAAFHALIHTGIGLRYSIVPCVVEGLAYLAHSWLPVGGDSALFDHPVDGFAAPPVPQSERCGAMELFALVRREGTLRQLLASALRTAAVRELPTGYFQRCMHVFAAQPQQGLEPDAARALLRYARRAQLPPSPAAAARALLRASMQLFVGTAHCDYFLLHGVTAASSLCSLVACLGQQSGNGKQSDNGDAMRACRRMLCALVAAYVAQGCPEIIESSVSLLEPPLDTLPPSKVAAQTTMDKRKGRWAGGLP
jgi:hypothetical protein